MDIKVKPKEYDRVEVRQDLMIGKQYDGLTWLEYMQHIAEAKKYLFKLVETIEQRDGRKLYVVCFLNSTIHWYLSEKMIIQVIPAVSEWDV